MGYGPAPWLFKGRAIYQLQLVKSEEARKYVPENLKLVELFGHTLGGFYLARYSDSPVGAFDELVVLGGLVWNAPTSCAWAARVYVNNKDARNHGLKEVGLPSRLAKFNAHKESEEEGEKPDNGTWWSRGQKYDVDSVIVKNMERRGWFDKDRGLKVPVCTFLMNEEPGKFTKGPRIKMSLPSFSGHTPDHPGMVKYALALNTNIFPMRALKLDLPNPEEDKDDPSKELMSCVLKGKPVVALSFNDMEMLVEAPTDVASKA